MPNMSRLFVSGKALLEGQLSEGKKERMGVEGKLGVKMVDGEGGVWDLDFMHWTSVDKYVFSNQWIQFVEEFGVVEGRVLQIWCLRDTDSQLCFAFNVMED
ncbi:hypothetical protein Sjap_001509 [Stephania japonica]|uniref:TF-B3 domain-containing protein n=1 Tax=Stephania japonica TaxID=461633 RepID=A0AAP0PTK3_9MAGN